MSLSVGLSCPPEMRSPPQKKNPESLTDFSAVGQTWLLSLLVCQFPRAYLSHCSSSEHQEIMGKSALFLKGFDLALESVSQSSFGNCHVLRGKPAVCLKSLKSLILLL